MELKILAMRRGNDLTDHVSGSTLSSRAEALRRRAAGETLVEIAQSFNVKPHDDCEGHLMKRTPEDKARQAHVAVRVLAHQAARNAVKNEFRRQGVRVGDVSFKVIATLAEAWLEAHPEMIAEARAKAASLGYAGPLRSAILAILPDAVVSRLRTGLSSLRVLRKKMRPSRDVFTEVYENDMWGLGGEFYSGPGSYGKSAQNYAQCVIKFINAHKIKSVIDLGCGDFAVGKLIVPECEHYLGVDVVSSLIERNKSMSIESNVEFKCLNITKDSLPDADLCLVRQVMQHLSNAEISQLLKKLKKYPYVIVAEHQPEIDGIPNIDIPHGAVTRTDLYRSGVYLDKPPFSVSIRQLAETGFDTQGGRLRIFQLLI